MASEGTRKTTSPGIRSGSRLVARIVSRGAARSNASVSAAVAARRCSQLSSTSSSSRAARKSITAAISSCAGSGLTSRAVAIASGTSRGSATAASSTSAAPDSYDGSTERASCSASRVLPDAAGTRQRQDARVPEQRLELRQLALPADERARIRRQDERCRRAERHRLLGERGGQLRELLSTLLGPVVVTVLRQQLARGRARARHGTPPPSSSAARRRPPASRRSTSTSTSSASDSTSSRTSMVSRAERASRDVHRLVQVVRGRSRGELAPEHVERLVAMQAMTACEREQLHELARLLQAPGGVGNDDAVDRGLESPQQLHADSHRRNLTLSVLVTAIRDCR